MFGIKSFNVINLNIAIYIASEICNLQKFLYTKEKSDRYILIKVVFFLTIKSIKATQFNKFPGCN